MSGPREGTIEPIYARVGARIAKGRQKRKMTQFELARKSGLARTTIANIERGEQRFLLHHLYEIADGLGVPAAKLLPPEKKSISERIESSLAEITSDDPEAASMIREGLSKAGIIDG